MQGRHAKEAKLKSRELTGIRGKAHERMGRARCPVAGCVASTCKSGQQAGPGPAEGPSPVGEHFQVWRAPPAADHVQTIRYRVFFHVVFVTSGPNIAPKMAQHSPNIAPRWPNIAPRWPQANIAPKMAQHSPNIAPRWPNIAQDGPT